MYHVFVSSPRNSRSNSAFHLGSHEQGATSQTSCSSVLRRRPTACECKQIPVLRTVTDKSSVNYGKRFWGCKNFKDRQNKGCNFFRWYDEDDHADERDLKIARQKRKIAKHKDEICMLKEDLGATRKWLKTSIVLGCVSLGINLVVVTMMLSSCKGNGNSAVYLN